MNELSKYLCLLLRYQPEKAELDMDEHGWVSVEQLIDGVNDHSNYKLDRELLEQIVAEDNKGRYRYDENHEKIKCCQGHSVPWVEPELEYCEPPEFLYHGTTAKSLEAIEESGAIKKMQRHAVHMQADINKAWQSAERWHKTPVVLKIAASEMKKAGDIMAKVTSEEYISKIKGGIYGLLIGDALGVPYEFHMKEDIPPMEQIEMTPPDGFVRAHSGTAPGTWSDDGAQALCLLDSLLYKGSFDLTDFSDRVLAWYENGLWAVDNRVFDVGIQTSMALSMYKSGGKPEDCGNVRPDGKGNGALMRVLPLALWHTGTDAELVSDVHKQCLITHGNITNQVCCALYCLIARELLKGNSFDASLDSSVQKLRSIYADKPEYLDEFMFRLQPDEPDIWIGKGGGYVVDSLRSAVMIMKTAASYEEAVKQAIALGDDTDTTACITGGIAGVKFGYDNIPSCWINALRDKDKVDKLINKLILNINHHAGEKE